MNFSNPPLVGNSPVVDKIDVVSRIVESASLDNLTLVEITAAALTVTGVLKIPTNFLT